MKIYLIRHGETDLNKQKRLQGQSDIELNELGRELAKVTGQALKAVEFDYVFSSPLARAMETARLVVGEREIGIIKDERIQEISFGEYEGLSYHPENYTVSDPDFINFFKAPDKYKVPAGGESFEEIIKRTGEFWKEIAEGPKYQDKTILISTHGCALKAILANIRKTPIAKFWGEGVHRNCAVTIVEIFEDEIRIEEGKIFYDNKS